MASYPPGPAATAWTTSPDSSSSQGLDRDRGDQIFTRMLTRGPSPVRHAWDASTEGMCNLTSY